MVIRCERCSTLYELDEALLSPAGSQVQCTRCQHVFTAFPPRAPGRTLVGVPAPPAQESAPGAAAPAPARAPSAAHARSAAPAAAPAHRPEPRAVRTAPPPVYRPSAGAIQAPIAGRAPLLRRDQVGTFENRLRWSARWRWLAPLLAAMVLAAAGSGAWLLLARRGDPDASRARADAMALVLQDDGASVDQGIGKLDAVLRRSPRLRSAGAERALAYVLRAAALAEEAEGLAARLAARAGERDRLRREQPEGWQDAERLAAAEVQKLEPEVRGREERARTLGGAAFQALKKLQAEGGDGPEVARAMACWHAFAGEPDRARKAVRAAREKAPADPWLDLAEGWADSRDPDRAARERALVHLGALAVAHPELLRARYLLARTEAALGRRGEALTTLERLLAANGRHEAARRLSSELAAAAAPVPPAPPPPAKAAPLAKKPVPRPRLNPSPAPDLGNEPELAPIATEPPAPRPARAAVAPAAGRAVPSSSAPTEPASGPPVPRTTGGDEPPAEPVEPRPGAEARPAANGG